jgi:hypothetical protein
MRIANWTLPLLLRKEKKLRQKFAQAINKKLAPDLAAFRSNPDMQVY